MRIIIHSSHWLRFGYPLVDIEGLFVPDTKAHATWHVVKPEKLLLYTKRFSLYKKVLCHFAKITKIFANFLKKHANSGKITTNDSYTNTENIFKTSYINAFDEAIYSTLSNVGHAYGHARKLLVSLNVMP